MWLVVLVKYTKVSDFCSIFCLEMCFEVMMSLLSLVWQYFCQMAQSCVLGCIDFDLNDLDSRTEMKNVYVKAEFQAELSGKQCRLLLPAAT